MNLRWWLYVLFVTLYLFGAVATFGYSRLQILSKKISKKLIYIVNKYLGLFQAC